MKATTKTQTIILTVIFLLQFSFVFAGSDGTGINPKKDIYASLAPTTPAEATFEDLPEMTVSGFDFSILAPVAPFEATFNEEIDFGFQLLDEDLSPKTPDEADFDEDEVTPTIDIINTDPMMPVEAGFEYYL